MKENIIKWIWQHKDYPNFKYNKLELTELLSKIEYNKQRWWLMHGCVVVIQVI